MTLAYDNMTRQLKAIFDSSTISTDSESNDIKFEPVFYVNKGIMVDIKIQKIVVEMVPVNIQGITIDIVETCHTEVTTVDRKKMLTNGGKKKNPLDKLGCISRCAICQSIYHWANDCPNKVKENSTNNVKITLFAQDVHSYYIEKFVGETLDCAVLDTGCTKNVPGQSWLDSYLDLLAPGDLLKVVEEKSSSSFKFGDGNTVL